MPSTTTRNAYALAWLAGVAGPDRPDSPGAGFLLRVQAHADEVLEDPEFCGDPNYDGLVEDADTCVPVYTHDRWLVFVDLAAYNEDISAVSDGTQDLTDQAGLALYVIAERLLQALLTEALDEDEGQEPAS